MPYFLYKSGAGKWAMMKRKYKYADEVKLSILDNLFVNSS